MKRRFVSQLPSRSFLNNGSFGCFTLLTYLLISNHEFENERSRILLCTHKMTNKRGQDTNNVPNRHIWIMREFLKQLKELYWGTIIIMSATVALSDHELADPSVFRISFIILIFFSFPTLTKHKNGNVTGPLECDTRLVKLSGR